MNHPRKLLAAVAFSLAVLGAVPAGALAGSDVMGEPLDGSSVQAFETGMETVKTGATAKEYQDLQSAIDYMMFYDLSVGRDKAKLFKKLDGKSPDEVIAMTKK